MANQTNRNNHQTNEMSIPLPEEGSFIDLNRIIKQVPENTVLRLQSGIYQLKKTIKIKKSIKLIGVGENETILTGTGLKLLIRSAGDHQIYLEGISFQSKSGEPSTTAKIVGGILNVQKCVFSGNVIDQSLNLGMGIFVSGNTRIDIDQCQFEGNQNAGLWIDDSAQGQVSKSSFFHNEVGLCFTGNTSINALTNHFSHNHVSLACDGSATGSIHENTFIENRGGILIKGKADVSIMNNAFNQIDGAAGFFEDCNVQFKENTIIDGDQSLVIRHAAKALIRKNRIENNEQGIICADKSTSEILENSILHQNNFGILVQDEAVTHISSNEVNENYAGIKFDNYSSFSAERNHITNNSYGVLATGHSKGKIHKNIIEKNNRDPMGWNVDIREAANVDFDDYRNHQAKGKPIDYSLNGNQFIVSAPSAEEKVSFSELLSQIKPGETFILKNGKYNLSDPIILEEPIKLIAESPGEVVITSDELNNLLLYQGKGDMVLIGIHFSLNSIGQTNVVIAKSGQIKIDQCQLEGGRDNKGRKRDIGAGLLLLGDACAEISGSTFKNNILGLSVQSTASVKLMSNKFFENHDYGVVFRDKSVGELINNEFYSNKNYGLMAYEESKLEISNNSCHDNQAGFGFMHQAKATIENSKSFENEYHGFFIDNDASCLIKNCQSYANEMSGVAIYGNNQSVLEGNHIYQNYNAGIESAEGAQSIIKNNKISENSSGILLADNAYSKIELNEIRENETGVKIQDSAHVELTNNKLIRNSEGAIVDWSDAPSIIGENEMFENGEPPADEDYEDDDTENGFGDFIAQIFGSENLSDDPNIAAIPITGDMLGHEDGDYETEKDDDEDETGDESQI